MATEDRHITRIEKTEALFRANGDHGQSAIFTDQNEEWVYYNDDKSLLYYAAAQKTWDGAAWAYIDNDFGEVTLHDDLLVDEYIKRSGGTDDYIRFENAKITIALTGADILVVEDDHLYISQDTRIGDAGAATELLEIKKDQDDKTVVKLVNYNNHADAASEFRSHSLGVFGVFGSYPALYDELECQNKTIVYSSKDLALIGYDDEILFYAGGHSASDIVLALSATQLTSDLKKFGFGTTDFFTWHTDYSVIQIGGAAAIMADYAAGANKQIAIMQNACYDSGDDRWEYMDTDEATLYYQADGYHFLKVAASGGGNSAISWIEAMRVNPLGVTFNVDQVDIDWEVHANGCSAIHVDSESAKVSINSDTANFDTEIYSDDYLAFHIDADVNNMFTQLPSIKTGEVEHNVEDCVLRCDINTGEIYGELYE